MDVQATLLNSLEQNATAKLDSLAAKGVHPSSGQANLTNNGREKDILKVKQLAHEFESVFMEQIFKSMRSTVQKSGLINGGNAEEIYTSMLDTEYAKQMSKQSQSGLADMIERQLLQTMGVKSGPSNSIVKKMAVDQYQKTGGALLRPDQKKVTIKAGLSHEVNLTRR